MPIHPPLAAISLLLLAGLGAGCADSYGVDDPAELVVRVRDNAFDPPVTDVDVGATVVWDFATASRPHNVVFDDSRSSEALDDGLWSTTLDEPGTYAYRCTLHSRMTGEITAVGS